MIKNIKVFIRRRLERLQFKKMKRRLKNKLDKFEPKTNLFNMNLLVNSKKKADYNMIMNSVRSKNQKIVIRNAHKKREIEKEVLYPKVIWAASNGTYVRKNP